MSAIYQYFPADGSNIHCIVCQYKYRKDAPLSTLQKHLRVKHGFSIRSPLSPEDLEKAINAAREPVFTRYLGPAGTTERQIQHPPISNAGVIKRVEDFKIVEPMEKRLKRCSASLERAIVKWVINDQVPISSATSSSFLNIFRKIDSKIILPDSQRLRALVAEAATNIDCIPKKGFCDKTTETNIKENSAQNFDAAKKNSELNSDEQSASGASVSEEKSLDYSTVTSPVEDLGKESFITERNQIEVVSENFDVEKISVERIIAAERHSKELDLKESDLEETHPEKGCVKAEDSPSYVLP